MSSCRHVVFLMPDTPRRAELWTPQAQALAESLNMSVQVVGKPFAPDCVRDAEAIMTSWGAPLLDKNYLDAAKNLKLVGHAAGSVQRVAGPDLFERGIPIVSANAEMARCVAQWSMMMTMIAARRMAGYCNIGEHRALQWRPAVGAQGLHQLTVGIWGYGTITRELIRLLRSTGVETILVASQYMDEQEASENGLTRVDLEELFERSDVVHLLTSLNADRVGRVDSGLLSRLHDGATLINASRAHLVDEEAMMNELRSGRLHACLDVYHEEPLPEDHLLRGLPNVVLTPHNAGTGTRDLYVPLVLREFDRCFRGKALQHAVSAKHAAAMTTEFKDLAKAG